MKLFKKYKMEKTPSSNVSMVLLIIPVFALILNTPVALGQRFIQDVFTEVDSVDNIIYGQAENYKGELQSLYVDIFAPKGDTLQARPLLLYAHGGGFAGGSHKYPSIRIMAKNLAKRGYVVASVNYRLDPNFDYGTSESKGDRKAMTDAMHDMRAAIRFFKAYREEFKIDTTQIFVGGESAGALTSMMVGYIDKDSELQAYPKARPRNVEGDSGTPGYSSKVRSVLCLCGAIADTIAIDSPDEPALLWIHGSSDPIVSMEWAEEVVQRAKNVGLPYKKKVFEGATHCPWIKTLPNWELYLDSLVNYVSEYMGSIILEDYNTLLSKIALSKLTVANVLQNDMVIQQGQPFKLWGTSRVGDTIRIEADWLDKPITVYAQQDNSWIGTLKVPKVDPGDFTARSIIISNTEDTIKLSNLLLGEVWFCAGQSNMEMKVGKVGWYSGILNYPDIINEAHYPEIRVYTEPARFMVNPQKESQGQWSICSPETVANYSAVAYFFGKRLFNTLDVPVGVVVSAAAGANGSAFIPKEVLLNDSHLKKKYWDPNEFRVSSQEIVDTLGFFTKVGQPTLMYNAMIHPLENLSIKGFLWYQGESNYADGYIYTRLMTQVIEAWRQKFGNKKMPFYFVQIAPYIKNANRCPHILGQFWESQMDLLQIEHTGMVLSMDVGELEDVHPRNKKPIGDRLARMALKRSYGCDKINAEGPVISNYKIKKNGTVVVHFKKSTVKNGLFTNDDEPPRHFTLAGKDRVFYPATARIKKNKIVVYSKQVPSPVALRYGFTNDAITNLENKEGIPAYPYRSDSWNICEEHKK